MTRFYTLHMTVQKSARTLRNIANVDNVVITRHNASMITYRKAADRREQITRTACELAEEIHYTNVRRHHLVDRCDTAAGNISRVMGSMDEVRTRLIEYALMNGRDTVVAQAIIDKHPSISHLGVQRRAQILAKMV